MNVWECALGFMDAQVLMTAEALGIFEALDDRPRTAAEVAAHAGLPEDSAARLLGTLCALGAVERRPPAHFVNGPEAAEQLVGGKPGYIGALLRHVREDLYPLWGHLAAALREGKPQWERAFGRESRQERTHTDPAALRAFHEGMRPITAGAAAELAAYAPELGALRRVVDIGGSSGAFLIELARAFPGLGGIVYDLPLVGPIAERHLRDAGLGGRLEFRAGDFFCDPLPAGADAYSLGFILHDWNTESGSLLLRKVADAAAPGALLIIGEYLLNDDRTGPLWVARSDLNMLVAARGRERTAGEYIEWMREFGFEYERTYLTSKGKNFLIARRA